ncbi:MAG: hypothetical protein QOF59_138 [Actinomycetota bacterium]|nr:hypothetical protein [Actinomycetota bacterium]
MSVTAGAASASSASAVAVVATHGLGARIPAGKLAPQAGHSSTLAVLPASVDLRKWAVTPGDQGPVGSCVTWAIDYAMLGWYARFDGRAGQPFAPMYTYSQIHFGAGDGGSYPGAAFEIARTQGNDTRAHYTQGDYNWQTPPTASERANAARFKIKNPTTLFMGANQVGAATLLKHALATNHPVAIEVAVRRGFDFLASNATAVDDDITSTVRGYHEVLAVGYDATGLVVQNSWGTAWAKGGFGRISWRVVQQDVWQADTIDGFVQPVTAPKVTAPVASVVARTATAPAKVTYKITWKGTVGNSGPITRYDAWSQTDQGAPLAVKLATATTATFTFNALVGHAYRFAVRATAGTHSGAIVYSAVITPKAT